MIEPVPRRAQVYVLGGDVKRMPACSDDTHQGRTTDVSVVSPEESRPKRPPARLQKLVEVGEKQQGL